MFKPYAACIYLGILMVVLIMMGCGKKEEPRTASPPAAPAAPSAPGSQVPEAPPPQAAPAPQPAAHVEAVLAKANPADAYVISANPELTGRLGRLVVEFPQGANSSNTRTDVMKAGENNSIQGGYGVQVIELLPGKYGVVISNKRIEGVTIEPRNNTRIRVGILRVTAGANTRVDIFDADKKTQLVGGYGKLEVGLPIGTYNVMIAQQAEPVIIKDGEVTDF